MFTLKSQPAQSPAHLPLRPLGVQSTYRKTSSTVQPCFVYASYPIAFRIADEIDSAAHETTMAYMDMATTILRRVYETVLKTTGKREDEEQCPEVGSRKEEEHIVAEPVKEAPAEAPEPEVSSTAIAMAQPVDIREEDDLHDFSLAPEVTETVEPRYSSCEPGESGADSDSASDSGDEEEEELHTPSSTISKCATRSLRRSPLSQSTDGLYQAVYAGYHCTIEGCDFAASTPQHVRHHMLTASHWYLLCLED